MFLVEVESHEKVVVLCVCVFIPTRVAILMGIGVLLVVMNSVRDPLVKCYSVLLTISKRRGKSRGCNSHSPYIRWDQ